MACKHETMAGDRVYELIKAAQAGDVRARTGLVEENIGLVKGLASRFICADWEMEDLVQVGYIGLLKAIDKFQPEFGVRFSTYAVPWIMGELKGFLRDNGRIKLSRSLKSEISRLRKAEDALKAAGNASPRVSEIAREMNLSSERVLEIMEAAATTAATAMVSLDDGQTAEMDISRAETDFADRNLEKIMVRGGVAALAERERQVIHLRYYRDMTQKEAAKILHISQVQVSRIEKKALAQLREKVT